VFGSFKYFVFSRLQTDRTLICKAGVILVTFDGNYVLEWSAIATSLALLFTIVGPVLFQLWQRANNFYSDVDFKDLIRNTPESVYEDLKNVFFPL
jgi:hypothetical protein